MRALIRALAMLAIVVAGKANAWNALGHKVIAEIAWRELSPEDRQQIVDVLRRHPRFDADFAAMMEDNALKGDKAIQDHWIFQTASTWPDTIRGNKEYDRPVWHYVDFPLYLDARDRAAIDSRLPVNISTRYPGGTPVDEFNILQAIQHCQAAIKSQAGADVKAVALCWLFHLVGDIHQPLHSTALFSIDQFPKGDRGGNEIKLVNGDNLHSLWDNFIGRQYYMRNVDKAVAELKNETKYGEIWESSGKETDVKKWADESHELCTSFLYDKAILDAARSTPPGTKVQSITLPETYYTAAGEHARMRVIAAGLRLAAVLKELDH